MCKSLWYDSTKESESGAWGGGGGGGGEELVGGSGLGGRIPVSATLKADTLTTGPLATEAVVSKLGDIDWICCVIVTTNHPPGQ